MGAGYKKREEERGDHVRSCEKRKKRGKKKRKM
jgi:hypothetical protein